LRYLLGIDLGTTAIKIGIFDENATKIGTATQEYKLITESQFAVEQKVSVYWESFKTCLKNVMHKTGISSSDILALSISAQGETMVFLGADGEPLYNAIVWMDNRAQKEAKFLEDRFDPDEIHRITGQSDVIPLSPGCKILWFKRNHPKLFEKTKKILLIEDYFFFRMCGEFYGEGSLWCSTHMWNINTKEFWQPILDELGVSKEQLPKVVESGTPLGKIIPSVASELGLSRDTVLVMGALDQSCGAIGVGNVIPGIFSESTGAAMVVCTMTEKPAIDPNRKLSCFYTGIPNMYMIHGFSSGGIALKWLRDALCSEEVSIGERTGKNGYQFMDMEASTISAGSDGLVVLPHFQGSGPPDTNASAKCIIYGLTLQHTKAHIIRGYLEAIAMSLCRIVEAVEEMGIDVKEIRSLSGGAKSDLWCQIKADALGKPVVTMKNTEDAACLGAALIAGAGIKLWTSAQKAAMMIVSEEKRYMPNERNHKAYGELLAKYKMLTKNLKPITTKM
jgi:sugar (pentulose or hexulose) kinase